jgi:glycogen debranching enzyme
VAGDADSVVVPRHGRLLPATRTFCGKADGRELAPWRTHVHADLQQAGEALSDDMRHDHVVAISLLLVCALLDAMGAHAVEALRDTPRVSDHLTWSIDSTQPARFIAVHGRRSAIFGYSEKGLEIWAYPLQLADSFSVAFRQQHGTTEIDGRTVLRRIVYTPATVTRIYVGPDFIVREKLFVPLEAPGAIVSYEVDGARPIDIVVRFTPVLNLMWPGAIGGQEAAWNAAASGYLLSEPLHRYTALVASPHVIAHDETPNATRPVGDSPGVAFTIRPSSDRAAVVVMAAGLSGEDPAPIAKELLSNRSALENAVTQHYAEVLDQALHIDTPDPEIDRALAWSQIALDQAWVCNPDLGCGQVAGYGPSRKARRPQYSWFFAGDGMVAARALLAAGRNERAREELELILRFQDRKTGMIWHELSQSAGVMEWRKYPYMYVHVDLSYDFLDIVANYYSVTGDLAFVKKNWNALAGAYRYCQSLLDSKDGLPRIPGDKQGFNEQDALSDELTLSAGWVAASEAFAALATATGRHAAARAAREAGQRARQAIGGKYWDERRRFWISGHTRSGAPLEDRDIRPMGVVRESLFSPEQRSAVLDQLASSDFQTDWGTRGKASNDLTYDPNSYASGSVWALATAAVASAFWAEHRSATAFPIWSALVPWSSLDSPGHMHETLAGDFYHEQVESVPEQTWSSAAFLTAAVQGLLGLRVDGVARHLHFAPHLSPAWNRITLRRIRVGGAEVTLDVIQSAGELALHLRNEGAPVSMSFDPELPLGAKVRSARIDEREIDATLVQHREDAHAHVDFDLPRGEVLLRIGYTGGVAIVPAASRPVIGEASRAMKIVSVSLKDRVYAIELDRLPSESTRFELRTSWKIEDVRGAKFEALAPASYSFEIDASPGNEKRAYERSKVLVTFASVD